MGLGTNCALDSNFKNYSLSNHTYLDLLGGPLSDAGLKEAKQNFQRWIEGNGLRELNESFTVFLDAIHWACMMIARPGPLSQPFPHVKLQKKFEKAGLDQKLRDLEKDYGVISKYKDGLLTLNRARNCLTHRRGIVGHDDLEKGESHLVVKWYGFDGIVSDASGNTKILQPVLPRMTISEVKLIVVERSKSFKLGEVIAFSTHDLAEICSNYWNETNALHAAVLEFARSKSTSISQNNLGNSVTTI
jgi:hypothetical protein